MLRLRNELDDEGIWMPDDDDLLALLLVELDYARHPHAHEGVAPRYGALLTTPESMRRQPAGTLEIVDISDIPLAVARRLADGRSSFVARVTGGGERLVCFDRTREYESSAVHLTVATGALVVQRLGRGWVRLSTPSGVATWDGIQWSTKPLSVDLTARIAPHAPGADPVVLSNIVELCTHWLAAGRVGATLVWRLDGDPRQLTRLGMGAAIEIPRLDLSHRAHFAALLNALAQYDRAALVEPHGAVSTVGVHLRSSERSRHIDPYLGTRHTSAMRFSAEEPSVVVFVVSSNGPLSVFCHGERLDTD
jgi:Probable sensor domain DACNK/DisA bacterial checkpoint controller nucleotide-binding